MTPRPVRRARCFVKSTVARILAGTGADRLAGALNGTTRAPLVLCYHRVVEDFAAEARRTMPPMLTSRRMLERQLDWIGRRFRFVALDELGERLEQLPDGKPVAAVTFDDGYRDVYLHALPILKRKGIPATVFVVTSLIDTRELHVHDRLYLLLTRAYARWAEPSRTLEAMLASLQIRPAEWDEFSLPAADPHLALTVLLRALSRSAVLRVMTALEARVGFDYVRSEGMLPLTWDMLAEMQAAGMSVGSHTHRHIWLTQESPATIFEELAHSRETIEERLGTQVRHLAYPDGRFTTTTARAVEAAGYRYAYTTCTHRHPRYPRLSIPRTLLWEHSCVDGAGRFSPAVMSCQIRGVFNALRGCEQHHG